jgi:phosphate transport system permease protein
MTEVAPAPQHNAGESFSGKAGGARLDRGFRAIALAAGLLVLAILALIAIATTHSAWSAFVHEGVKIITSRNWNPNLDHFGGLDFIFGTVLTSVIALVLAVPTSLGIALFITELAPRGWRTAVTYAVDILAAIPSVVYGYWALAVLSKPITTFYARIANSIGTVPGFSRLFGGFAQGSSFMTAGLILAVMIIPIVTSLSREALITVSQDDKNAALAMGATRIEMLRVAVFPRVRSGLTAAAMLGLGRAMGETMAVALVVGSSHKITSHLFRSGDTITSIITHEFPEATDVHRAALIALGVVLFVITIAVNMIARAMENRSVLAGSAR